MASRLSLLLLLLSPPLCRGLDNGLGRLPGLGWNSDYCTNCSDSSASSSWAVGATAGPNSQNEKFVRHIADWFHTHKYPMASDRSSMKTMQQLGFHYVNIDANWDLLNRSAGGDLVPDPKLYPSGLDTLVSYVHSLNLGFGLYGDRGTMDCGKAPGQYQHEAHDSAWLASHKIDWFKSDSCYTYDRGVPGDQGHIDAIILYEKMRDGFNKSGYPVWWALCGWDPLYAGDPRYASAPIPGNKYPGHPVGTSLANSARIGPDTGGGWTAALSNLQNALPVQQFAGPHHSGGFWNDGCLPLTPGKGCKGEGDSIYDGDNPSDDCMTNRRFRSMYALWTVLSFNVLLSGDFERLNSFVMSTWANDVAVGINQDHLGVPAQRVDNATKLGPGTVLAADYVYEDALGASSGANVALMSVAECGGEPTKQKWVMDKPEKGFISNAATKTCINVIGCEKGCTSSGCTKVVYDPCRTAGNGTCGPSSFANERWTLTTAGQLQSAIGASSTPHVCAELQHDKSVALSKCTSPPTAAQTWKFSASTGQLTGDGGMCVTASSPKSKIKQETLVIARPLAGAAGARSRSFAMVFLNNKNHTSNVTCDKACMANMLALAPKPPGNGAKLLPLAAAYVLEEVWDAKPLEGHTPVRCSAADGCSPVTVTVASSGGTMYVRLLPHDSTK